MPPAPAERVRTILARAATARVTWLDPAPGEAQETEVLAGLRLVEEEPLAVRPVLVEVADAAPLPVPDRIRARVRLHGYAAASVDAGPVSVQVQAVALRDREGDHPVCPSALLAAEPDPLAEVEGSLLSHLDTAHPGFLDAITGLVRAEQLLSVVRVWPLELDRSGVVLRLQYARRHRDVRLGFPARAATTDEALERLRALAVLGAGRHRCRVRAADSSEQA